MFGLIGSQAVFVIALYTYQAHKRRKTKEVCLIFFVFFTSQAVAWTEE